MRNETTDGVVHAVVGAALRVVELAVSGDAYSTARWEREPFRGLLAGAIGVLLDVFEDRAGKSGDDNETGKTEEASICRHSYMIDGQLRDCYLPEGHVGQHRSRDNWTWVNKDLGTGGKAEGREG